MKRLDRLACLASPEQGHAEPVEQVRLVGTVAEAAAECLRGVVIAAIREQQSPQVQTRPDGRWIESQPPAIAFHRRAAAFQGL